MATVLQVPPRLSVQEACQPMYLQSSSGELSSFEQSNKQQVTLRSPSVVQARLGVRFDTLSCLEHQQDPKGLLEPVPLELVGTCDGPLSSCEADFLAQPGLLPWEPSGPQTQPAPVCVSTAEAEAEGVDSTSRAKRYEEASPKTDASSLSGKPEDRLENIRKTNREAQKRWRQRNKGRVRLQQQQIQTQQEQLAEAQQDARQARAELQAALQALDSLQMSQVEGLARDCAITPELAIESPAILLPPPERNLRTLGDQVRMKVDELDRLRSCSVAAPLEVFDLADDITSMIHSYPSPVVDGKPFMQSVWPQGSSPCLWQWNDLVQQYSAMWAGDSFKDGFMDLSISGQAQQISIASIVKAPFEEFMTVKDRYIKSIRALLETAGTVSNSPAGLRAQQLVREAVVLTFYACFLSPKRLCRACAFNYQTKDETSQSDPSVWTAVMEAASPDCVQYQGMRRLHDICLARLEALQKVRVGLSSRVGLLASTQPLGHIDYSRIFAAIQALQHSVALEQKLRHEVTVLCCSTFNTFQVANAMAMAYPRFLDPLCILEAYTRHEPASLRGQSLRGQSHLLRT